MLNAFTAKYKDSRKTPNDIFRGYFKIVSISIQCFYCRSRATRAVKRYSKISGEIPRGKSCLSLFFNKGVGLRQEKDFNTGVSLWFLRISGNLQNISGRLITAQKMKLSIKNFFSKCDQICRKLQIWSNLLKKSFM